MRKGKSSNRYRTVTIDHKKTYSRSKIEVKKITFLTVFLLCLTIGTSYAFLTQVITGTKVLSIVSGTFKIDFNDGNEINIENAQPITNEEGLNIDGYTFTITNNGSIDAKYKVTLEEKDNNTLNKEYIRYSYKKKNGTYTTPKLLSEGLEIISNEELNSGAEEEYTLKLWMDYDTPNEGQNKTFKARIIVDSTQKENEQEEETKIELLGDKNTTILKNTTYVDPGYVENENVERTYEYYDGTTLSEVNEIDTTKVGIYYIHYKKEINGKIIHEVRVVNVVEEENKELPSITLIGNEEITISKGETYQDEGYTSSDEVITIGEVNTEVVGTYIIRYIAKKNNELASVVRVINVEEAEYRLTYNYTENGGSNENETSMVERGIYADLTKTGEKSGYTFVGWNTNKDAHEGLSEVIVNETTTLYAIYSKASKTYTVTFDKNATTGQTKTESCTIPAVYNKEEQDTTCNITSPTITVASGYNKVGYSKSSTGTTSTWNEGAEKAISSNETYYAIQSKTVTLTFTKGSNTSSIGSTTLSCTMYNNGTCSITMPSITPASGYATSGWRVSSGTLNTSLSTEPTYYTPGTSYMIENTSTTNTIALTSVTVVISVKNFSYTGGQQTYTIPTAGKYKLEVWGAQGGNSASYTGGKGGYSYGTTSTLAANTILYVYVGGQGVSTSTNNTTSNGGYNGGGFSIATASAVGASGGGATHIATKAGLLSSLSGSKSSVLIVAGAGGGAGQNSNNGNGFAGGGVSGLGSSIGSTSSISSDSTFNTAGGGPGTQTNGGNSYQYSGYDSGTTAGGFGKGGDHYATHTNNTTGGGGGSGYYGGGGAAHSAGGGGSGYIGSLSNAATIAGNTSFTAPGGSSETGHSGNGYARITYVGP